PATEPTLGARPPRPEVSEDRLRVSQRRGPGADPQRRQGARRPEAVLVHLHGRRRGDHEGRVADPRRRKPRQRRRRLPGQVRLRDSLQFRGGRHPRRDDGEGTGSGGRVQPQAHRGCGEERRLPDPRRRSRPRRPARVQADPLY
ncbi:hypothetical protein OY671_013073, partial [Metschnikowia pulcherrima]